MAGGRPPGGISRRFDAVSDDEDGTARPRETFVLSEDEYRKWIAKESEFGATDRKQSAELPSPRNPDSRRISRPVRLVRRGPHIASVDDAVRVIFTKSIIMLSAVVSGSLSRRTRVFTYLPARRP
jgi:hypothetical protein